MSKTIDHTGKRYHRLTVVSLSTVKTSDGKPRWNCVCDCGVLTVVSSTNIGRTKSCGCIISEAVRLSNTTHGGYKSSEYSSYRAMITRCTNPNSSDYERYGKRGITVCQRWMESFENFMSDMKQKPAGNYSIERQNNNGNYEPNNCFWATPKQQANNRSSTVLNMYEGELLSISAVAEKAGIRKDMLSRMLGQGYTFEAAVERLKVSKPRKKRRPITNYDDNPQAVHMDAKDIWGTVSPEGTIVNVNHVTGQLEEEVITPHEPVV